MQSTGITAKPNGIRDSLLIFASIVIILAGARTAAHLLEPFLLAVFIAVICAAPINRLKARGLPGWLASLCVLLVLLLSVGLLFVLLGSTAEDFTAALPGYQQQFTELLARWTEHLEGWGLQLSRDGLRKALDPGAAVGFFGGFIGGLGDALSNMVLILFTVIFILADAAAIPAKLAAGAPRGDGRRLAAANALLDSMDSYVRTKAAVSALTGGLIWIGLLALGVPFAGLWAFVAFLLNFIPNIGSIVAAVPPVLLSLLEGSPVFTGLLISLYLGVNLLVGNVIEPRWLGQAVGLSTLAVFVSLVFWGYMFGAVGMLLSVPLTMVIKFLALQHPGSRWFAMLLSSWPAPELAPEEPREEAASPPD